MALRVNENTEAVVYKTVENEREVEKVRILHAEVPTGDNFRKFNGELNSKGNLVRSFRLTVPESVANYLKENGVPVSDWDTGETVYYFVTIKINYNSGYDLWIPTIAIKEGEDGKPTAIHESTINTLQNTRFSDSRVTARITHGTYLNKPYTSLYLDRAGFVKVANEINPYEKEMFEGFDVEEEEELPF